MSEANDQHRVTVSCKIPATSNEKLEAYCKISGVNKSQVLANLIAGLLGETDDEVANQQARKRLLLLVANAI